MFEVDKIKRRAMNFSAVVALFSFPTFPAWAWQEKFKGETLKEGEERYKRKEWGSKKRA